MRDTYNAEICIIGLGPAGLGAAIGLLRTPLASSVACVEAGESASARACAIHQGGVCQRETPCQMISGFGGCSLLGGSKISGYPAGSGLANVFGSEDLAESRLGQARESLADLIHFEQPCLGELDPCSKAGMEALAKLGFNCKHYDVSIFDQTELRMSYASLMDRLVSSGIRLQLGSFVSDVRSSNGVFEVEIQNGQGTAVILAKRLVLGTGRLGQGLLDKINAKLGLGGRVNHVDLGVRLEFPASLFPDIDRFHADLKLLYENSRTFCVCKNGVVAPYMIDGIFFAEGHFDSMNKSGLTNLAVLTRFGPGGGELDIVDEVMRVASSRSGGRLIRQSLMGYLGGPQGRASIPSDSDTSSWWMNGEVDGCFPAACRSIIKEAVRYFAERLLPTDQWSDVSVFAPEVDYGHLWFPVDSNLSVGRGIHIVGSCTGRFRGILQSYCSGLVCAESLARELS